MEAAPSNWHCSRFKEQESILGFRRIRSENSSGSSSFSSRSLRAKRRRKPARTASFPSYDGASVHILASSSFTETDHRLSYSSRTGRAQGSLGYHSLFTCLLSPLLFPPVWLRALSCLINLITWIYNFNQEIKVESHLSPTPRHHCHPFTALARDDHSFGSSPVRRPPFD